MLALVLAGCDAPQESAPAAAAELPTDTAQQTDSLPEHSAMVEAVQPDTIPVRDTLALFDMSSYASYGYGTDTTSTTLNLGGISLIMNGTWLVEDTSYTDTAVFEEDVGYYIFGRLFEVRTNEELADGTGSTNDRFTLSLIHI